MSPLAAAESPSVAGCAVRAPWCAGVRAPGCALTSVGAVGVGGRAPCSPAESRRPSPAAGSGVSLPAAEPGRRGGWAAFGGGPACGVAPAMACYGYVVGRGQLPYEDPRGDVCLAVSEPVCAPNAKV